jgi:hypothetical protein
MEGSYYYDLFKFFSDEHGLILLDSEIQDIIYVVEEFKKKELADQWVEQGIKFSQKVVTTFEEWANLGLHLRDEEVNELIKLIHYKDKEIERLKGLIDDAYSLGYDHSSFSHDSSLQEQFDAPETLEQFKINNKIFEDHTSK